MSSLSRPVQKGGEVFHRHPDGAAHAPEPAALVDAAALKITSQLFHRVCQRLGSAVEFLGFQLHVGGVNDLGASGMTGGHINPRVAALRAARIRRDLRLWHRGISIPSAVRSFVEHGRNIHGGAGLRCLAGTAAVFHSIAAAGGKRQKQQYCHPKCENLLFHLILPPFRSFASG